ncbi:DUF1194 domain-containing protein [Elioraea sp.]|jgi:hypothetical protein|uniref:DUF1194 domain-containing protein n=1 Tax=Elioraea sp. TaxID=2185103 RepID=UPI0021DF1A9D|nr:DUF1194 domain-containing protein [Elioraea sp.]GIX10023.1 MAG: hypothetical protein KatS3mg116_1733 [Elioraea sp.]
MASGLRPIPRRDVPAGAHPAQDDAPVDVALVLAIDASGSVTDEALRAQRRGHAEALASEAFVAAVLAGVHGRVAVTVIEWSSGGRQEVTVPWTVIAGMAQARAVAERILGARPPLPGHTSISGAIDAGVALLARFAGRAARRVIDISANGPNNDGRALAEARRAALEAGVTVNGLAILDADPDLARYFAAEVIGGPGAFVLPAEDAGSYRAAVLRKLTTEIAGAGRWA